MTRLLAITLASLVLSVPPWDRPHAPAVWPTPRASASHPLATPHQEPLIFRSGVDLVRLDVQVTTADGTALTDLRRDEVEVVEGGSLRPVLLFQHVEAPPGTPADLAQRTVATEVSTNQGSAQGHLYVLVFDQAHLRATRAQPARRAVDRFLQARVRPGDRVALYALPGPGPQSGLTGDVARIRRELQSINGTSEETAVGALTAMRVSEAYEIARGNEAIITRVADRVTEERIGTDAPALAEKRAIRLTTEDTADLRRQVQEDARMLVARADAESRRFLSGLRDVIAELRSVEGRKSVVLFSEGFEVDNLTHEIEQVAAAAAQSSAIVYSMDFASRAVDETEERPRGGEIITEARTRLQGLGSLSGETSGMLVTDAAMRIDDTLASLAQASQDYYMIGFAPAATGGDREAYRRVEVRVKRRGARVRVRTGYAIGPAATPADRRRSIDAALRAPFPQQGLRVEYTTYVLGGGAGGQQRVFLSLAAELPVASQAGQGADVVFVVRAVDDGRVVATGTDRIALPPAKRAGATTGLAYHRVEFDALPGLYLMRAVVREPGGLVGSADRRFRVRALGGPGLTASDLVLGSDEVKGLPVRAAVRSGEMLPGGLELYARSRSQLERAVVAIELLPLGGGSAITTTRADFEDITETAGLLTRRASISLPLGGIAPGRYLVRAVVRSGQDAVTELLREVQVTPGS